MENKIKIYTDLKQKYLLLYKEINKKYNFVSTLRFSSIAIILCLIFFYFKTDNLNFIWTAIVIFFVFFLLVKWHDKISFKRKIYKTLKIINQEEINYLENNETPFENGIEYLPKNHDYAFDLDILGNKSLFHNLNRTASFIGKKTLAKNLLNIKLNNEILENQESIKELTLKIDFRQKIYSLTRIKKDSEEIYQRLINWTSKKEINSFILKIISFVFPALFLFFFIMTFINENQFYSKIASLLFMVNLMIIGKYFKKIKKEIAGLSKINETIRNYSLIIEIIENEKFTSAKLIGLQKKLEYNSVKASVQINNLSSIVKQIESIHNPIGALFTNGFFLYHLHSYRTLVSWKNNFADQIPVWLNIIGEFEALNSFANFSFNNPSYCFPEINSEYKISFKELSHPLINKEIRVNNDVSFNENNFIILTGSNMSGKSTFLRSLGINMVLAGVGAPICSTKANVHPLKVLVSMRLSDSLEENESYFFAEVKRLKEIMTKLEKEKSFILLDEILRGTNSDDKRLGTIEVIKKMISKKAIGAIATHDLEVCKTTDLYPEILVNKNFEVEIIDNDLFFDYKLREGVCKNKSASFLMKKMKVI